MLLDRGRVVLVRPVPVTRIMCYKSSYALLQPLAEAGVETQSHPNLLAFI